MPAKTKEEIKLESAKRKTDKKSIKKKSTSKKSLTSVYKKVSIAMQNYYRSKFVEESIFCFGQCGKLAELMHHHSHWGQSVALRFETMNLVPLCKSCHCAFHKSGNFKIKFSYESNMKANFGQDWEDKLIYLERSHVLKTDKEKRQELYELINHYSLAI